MVLKLPVVITGFRKKVLCKLQCVFLLSTSQWVWFLFFDQGLGKASLRKSVQPLGHLLNRLADRQQRQGKINQLVGLLYTKEQNKNIAKHCFPKVNDPTDYKNIIMHLSLQQVIEGPILDLFQVKIIANSNL